MKFNEGAEDRTLFLALCQKYKDTKEKYQISIERHKGHKQTAPIARVVFYH